MKDWRNTLIDSSSTIQDAIGTIDSSALQIGLVVDGADRLIGTVTDGDIRRSILRNEKMDAPISLAMNPKPHVASVGVSDESLLRDMKLYSIRQIPIVDENRKLVDLAFIDDLLAPAGEKDNWVVLMAGGLGSRLRPLTNVTPKPLLPIGSKPLLETILENFIKQNFKRFYISVNYKSEMIRSYFGDGDKWGAQIRYLEEDEQLGTAGALRLIPDRGTHPFIVMNADLLTQVNFQHLLEYHSQNNVSATMCVRTYDFQVPFGVIHLEENGIKKIDEKPLHYFLVNAGIYALNPDVIDLIPNGQHFDMTNLFELIIENNIPNTVFPIREYWLDVGRIDDLNKAKQEFDRIFTN